MKTILKSTQNWTAVDTFNGKMALSLKDVVGQTLTVYKVATGMDVNEKGEEIASACLITETGAYGTISGTAVELCAALIDIFTEGNYESIQVAVEARRANSGRDYLALSIVG